MMNLSCISITHLPSAQKSGPEVTKAILFLFKYILSYQHSRETFSPLPASVESSNKNTPNTTSFGQIQCLLMRFCSSLSIYTLYTLLHYINTCWYIMYSITSFKSSFLEEVSNSNIGNKWMEIKECGLLTYTLLWKILKLKCYTWNVMGVFFKKERNIAIFWSENSKQFSCSAHSRHSWPTDLKATLAGSTKLSFARELQCSFSSKQVNEYSNQPSPAKLGNCFSSFFLTCISWFRKLTKCCTGITTRAARCKWDKEISDGNTNTAAHNFLSQFLRNAQLIL